MPKGFTETEFTFFNNKLIETGEKLFAQKGLSGVSIDNLVKEVGIAKGSFYKFFSSKEDLCFQCLMNLEKNVRDKIFKDLEEFKETPGILFKKLVLLIPEIINKHPLINIFQNKKDLQSLFLKVDPIKQQENFNGDSFFMGKLFNGTGVLEKADKDTLTALIWGLIFMYLNKEELNGQIDPVFNLIADMAESHFKQE